MKYIFLTTKKEFTESSYKLQNCGISMHNTLLFEIKNVSEDWAKEHLTKKAYNDVYLNKSTFDDELTIDSLRRLYNIIQIFKYIEENDIGKCIIIENINEFCQMYNNSTRNIINIYITNHKSIDLLFLDNSYKINYSHYKYFGDSFKQNEYVYKKVPAFYINDNFIRKFLKTQSVFYKPFEYTLNDYVNESHIITFLSNKDIADMDEYYNYRNTIIVNSGKILLSVIGLGSAILMYNKYRK